MRLPINGLKILRALAGLALALGAARPGLAVTPTVVHSFEGTDGSTPMDGLAWNTNGYFYGTTRMGGAYLEGTMYSINPAFLSDLPGTVFESVYQFDDDNGGFAPFTRPVLWDGMLVATSFNGASGNAGALLVLYQSGPNTWSLTNAYDFSGGSDGGFPEGALIQGSDGNYYGTTSGGGAYGFGTVFQFNPGTFALTNLHSFTGGLGGDSPSGALVQGADGQFYGTTLFGGLTNWGTIYSIGLHVSTNSSYWQFNTLYRFTGGADGGIANGGLVLGIDGYYYGVTHHGGTIAAPTVSGGGGTIYRFNAATGVLVSLYSFGDDYPQPLMQGTDGNFYGTTGGGSDVEPYGTVFQITPSGGYTTLFTFAGTNGSNPSGPLVQFNSTINSGYLFGTTSQGGAYGNGTVFYLAVPTLGLTNQLISGINQGQAGFSVSTVVPAGASVQLQAVDSVDQTNWVNVFPNTPILPNNPIFPNNPFSPNGGLVTLTDPAAAGLSQRFYRVAVTLFPSSPIMP